MNHFDYRDGEMFCEGVSLTQIAAQCGTPVYVYSTATLERHYDVFKAALAPHDALIAFAMKANSNLAVLRVLANKGAGADTVSAGEIKRALAAGIAPDKIIFSGVGKTEAAKQIATYLYGSEEKLLRFDMNEFVSPADVARLVGTFDQPEGLLTSAIRRQPFSVEKGWRRISPKDY